MKWVLGIVAAIVVLAIVALAAVPYLVDTPRIQAYIASNATQTLGRPVKFSSVSVRVLPLPAVQLHDLEVAEDPKFGTAPFLKLKTGRIRLRLLPLLTGRVELGDIVLDKPVVTIVQTADGRLNISTLGTGANAKPPAEPARVEASAKAGPVTIDMPNSSGVSHNIAVQQGTNGAVLGASSFISKGSTSVTVTLKPGAYTFFCQVPGHRAAGMEGTLSVK